VEPATVAELQVVLEGVSLPAERSELLRYAAEQRADAQQLGLLRRLPERRYDTIDEVGEELVQVQPAYEQEEPHSPREESGDPPGREAYTQPHPESGAVRI
jgi:hypothetical protein